MMSKDVGNLVGWCGYGRMSRRTITSLGRYRISSSTRLYIYLTLHLIFCSRIKVRFRPKNRQRILLFVLRNNSVSTAELELRARLPPRTPPTKNPTTSTPTDSLQTRHNCPTCPAPLEPALASTPKRREEVSTCISHSSTHHMLISYPRWTQLQQEPPPARLRWR